MDISETLKPKSDQLNADDLTLSARTYTVDHTVVTEGEQPVALHLVEYPGHPYKPSKSMRRVIGMAWGKESDAYTGRRLTLYREAEIKWGGEKVGGIRISHMSHIDKPLVAPVTESKTKRSSITVQPLKDPPATKSASAPTASDQAGTNEPTAEQVAACTNQDELRTMWHASGAKMQAIITARVAELKADQ